MARIPRDEIIWRRLNNGRVQHAVRREGAGFRAVCGVATQLLWYPKQWWYDDPSAPPCPKCTRRIEPAQEG